MLAQLIEPSFKRLWAPSTIIIKRESIKKTLNSVAGTYIVINLLNGKMYVGSASLNRMYRRILGHLLLAKGGSPIVNSAVKKYGVENFAFVVIETQTASEIDRNSILNCEQKSIDMLNPEYNIAKKAGSLLGFKWSLESRKKLSLSVTKEQRERIGSIWKGKTLSQLPALDRSI